MRLRRQRISLRRPWKKSGKQLGYNYLSILKAGKEETFVLSRRLLWIISVILFLVAFIIYLPALQNEFVNWDDPHYVYKNTHIRSIDLNLIHWAFTNLDFGVWHPLTFLSLAIDYSIWGNNPAGYHLTNILLHSANTVFVFFTVLFLMRERSHDKKKLLVTSFSAALIFSIHPMSAESVVWVTERKDVLCAFFYLLAIIAYIQYINFKSKSSYIYSILFFMLAIMSKPMAVSIPLVMLLVDYYPFERYKRVDIKRLLLEKLPFILMCVMVSLVTLSAHTIHQGVRTQDDSNWLEHPAVTIYSFAFYIVKMVFPFNLAPVYIYPKNIDIFGPEYIISFIFLITITALSVLLFRASRLFVVIWVYYIITLLPVIGIVQIKTQIVANRFIYLPGIGLFILVGLALSEILDQTNRRKIFYIAVPALLTISGLLVNMTWKQISLWHDPITFWSYEMKCYPRTTFMAHIFKGEAYLEAGLSKEAIDEYDLAIKTDPTSDRGYYERGVAYGSAGRYIEALNDFAKTIEINPLHKTVYNVRALAYRAIGNYQGALIDLNKAIDINPQYAEAYYNLGLTYLSIGDKEQAVKYYRKAASLGLKVTEDILKR